MNNLCFYWKTSKKKSMSKKKMHQQSMDVLATLQVVMARRQQLMSMLVPVIATSNFRQAAKRKRINSFFEDAKSDPEMFRKMVRISLDEFSNLHDRLREQIILPRYNNAVIRPCNARLSSEQRLLLFLSRSRGNIYYDDLEQLSGLSASSLCLK